MDIHARYLFFTLSGLAVLLTTVGLVNYWTDPGQVYHVSTSRDSPAYSFAERLKSSRLGLLWPNDRWNDRDVKASLARMWGGEECGIIGSSRMMQFSSFRQPPALTADCPSLVNLSVSGAAIEDFVALSHVLLAGETGPQKVVFGVDPWTLDFDRDPRWERYRESFYAMRGELAPDWPDKDSGKSWSLATNLINMEYFVRSLSLLQSRVTRIQPAPAVNPVKGYGEPILLPDGSLVYSRSFIEKSRRATVPIGGSNYKLKSGGEQISEPAIELFARLLRHLQQSGMTPMLVLAPFHPNVWKNELSPTARALLEVEPRVRSLGACLGIKVLGSYDPRKIGCGADDFYDQGHAMGACLARIGNKPLTVGSR